MNPAIPFIPDTAPFSPEQRAWLNGFFAGLFPRTGWASSASQAVAPATPATTVTILFASQTGTAEALAKQASKTATKRGFAPKVLDLASCNLEQLAALPHALLIASTYGDGGPPDGAKALHTALAAAPAGAALANVRFAVCSLGDTNYAKFCQCGKDFDAYFEKLGATRVAARVDCDVDYEDSFNAWLDGALQALSADAPNSNAASPVATATSTSETEAPRHSRKNPFAATVLEVRKLNAEGSAKDVHHVEFSLDGSGLVYEAGDALGVFAHNCPSLVADVLAALGADGEEAVPAPTGEAMALRRALTECYDLGRPSVELIALLQSPDAAPPDSSLHVLDLLLISACRPRPADFVAALKKIAPRLYSISSSPHAHAGQVHLTVGAVRYDAHGRTRKGLCSTFLAERALARGQANVFVHTNAKFRPPADPTTTMIMVGPGTGIAPFRAFLHHRRATGATGRNWLFFGDQRAATDFLYRDELQTLQTDGVLTRLDLAWSRDQSEKVYVQQRMREQATELFAWLEAGAHFYVCGDASRMARDVHAALLDVVTTAGDRSPEEAASYVQQLQQAKRYQRDVY